jgi:hypothetical protein
MASTKFSNVAYPTFDFVVKDGIVPIIEGQVEEEQAAALITYLQLNTIPQLPAQGSPWMQYLTGETDFSDLDNTIRNNLIAIGLVDFNPDYDIVNDRLTVKVRRV